MEEIARELERPLIEETDSEDDENEVVSEDEDDIVSDNREADEFIAEENYDDEDEETVKDGEYEVGKVFYGKKGYEWYAKTFKKPTSKPLLKTLF